MAKSSAAMVTKATQERTKAKANRKSHRFEVEKLDDGSFMSHGYHKDDDGPLYGSGRTSASHPSFNHAARHMKTFFGEDED